VEVEAEVAVATATAAAAGTAVAVRRRVRVAARAGPKAAVGAMVARAASLVRVVWVARARAGGSR